MTESRQILSVSKLNRHVATLLEQQVGTVWLEAEIGQFTAASSGHWYLTLKDSQAQLRCAMFKFKNRSVRVRPKQGDHVLVKANVSLYQPRGEYQLVIETLMPAGSGKQQLALEQLKAKLNAEGLFDAARKRPIPKPLRTLGIITSATGAAIQDVLTVLERRDPHMQIIIYPSQVQGEQAPSQLVAAIEKANQRNEVDLLLLTRGGGSQEDLDCFNAEPLAYAIAESALPIVSAVGHEVDVTISDLVADLRAPTPSAAAELISQHTDERHTELERLSHRLHTLMTLQLAHAKQRLLNKQNQLERQAPAVRLHTLQQQFDEKTFRLHRALAHRLKTAQMAQQKWQLRLQQQHPQRQIDTNKQHTAQLTSRLHHAIAQQMQQREQQWHSRIHELDLVNPLSVLGRGYSITTHNEQIVRDASTLHEGAQIKTQLAHGELLAEVKTITQGKQEEKG